MKQIGRKISLAVLAMIFAIAVCCGFATMRLTARAEDSTQTEWETEKETVVEKSWFKLTYSENELKLQLNGDFRDYLDMSGGDFSVLKDTLYQALKEIVVESILHSPIKHPEYESPIDTMALPEDFDPSEVWGDSGLMSEFKSYIEEQLSKPEEMDKFLGGEYDALLDYAIGEYIQSQGDKTEEELQEVYDKVQEAVKEVVDKAIDSIIENLGDDATEEKAQWEDKKEQVTEKVNERVDQVQQNGGKADITFEQILDAFQTLDVNDVQVYEAAYGIYVDKVFSVLKTIMKKPSEIAVMSDEELGEMFKFHLDVGTTFGMVDFDVVVGFYGNTSMIKRAAQEVAEFADIAIDGGNVTINLSFPDFVGDVLAKFANTSSVSENIRLGIFNLFGKTVGELFDKTTGITYEELIGYLKGTDYQKWLSNFLNADFINSYFGNYIGKVLGHELSQSSIDNLIAKLLEKAKTVAGGWTYDDVYDFLTKIPGMSSVLAKLPQDKLESAVNKLLNALKRIDWSKYDVESIKELLKDGTRVNDKIESWLEKGGEYSEIYDKFVGYAEKLFDRVPESLKSHKLVGLYESNNNFYFEGAHKFDISEIFESAAEKLRAHGYDTIADYVADMKFVVDKTEYDLNLTFSANVPNVYKVEYVLGDSTREGLLPVGADIEFYAGTETVSGQHVLYWVLDEGDNTDYEKAVTKMPAQDARLLAVTGFEMETTIDGIETHDLNRSYGIGVKSVLKVTPKGTVGAQYTYEWHKVNGTNDVKLENATDTLTVENVADSGKYYVLVTDQSNGKIYSSEDFGVSFNVVITPLKLEFTYNLESEDFTYDGTAKTVDWTVTLVTPAGGDLNDYVTVIMGETSKVDAGTYTATLNITLQPDLDEANFDFTEINAEQEWTISPAEIEVTVKLATSVFNYDGSQHTVEALVSVDGNSVTQTDGYVTWTYGGTSSATNIGEYTVTVTVAATKNYTITGEKEFTFNWKIVGSDDDFLADGTEFTSGGSKPAAKVRVPGGIVPKSAKASFAEQKDFGEYADEVKNKIGKYKEGTIYEIHFETATGDLLTFNEGKFKVSLLIPDDLKKYPDNRLRVIHIHDGQVEVIDSATRDGDYMVFETTGFSVFAVVGIESQSSLLWLKILLLIILILLLIILILMIWFDHKDRGGNDKEESSPEAAAETDKGGENGGEAGESAEAAPETQDAAANETAATAASGAAVVAAGEEYRTVLNRSFRARLTQADKPLKAAYNDLKNYVLAYEGVESRISWGFDFFHKGRERVARVQIRGGAMYVYFPLDPGKLDEKYHITDVSDKVKYANTPARLRIKSDRALAYAKQLVDMVMKELGIAQGEIGSRHFAPAYASTRALIEKGDIKEKRVSVHQDN